MTSSLSSGWVFDAAQVAVLAVVARAETLADVLGTGVASRSDRAGAREELRGAGVIDDDDEVADLELVRAVRALTDPTLEVSMRCVRAGLRAVLAIDPGVQALAVLSEERVSVRTVWAGDVRSASRTLGGVLDTRLGGAVRADVPTARFALRPLSDRLAGSRDVHDVATAFAGQGMSTNDASRLAGAVASASHRTEIVARLRAGGLPTTSVGAIAVLDGPAGRVIAGPDLSVEGTPWTTFSPGTALRLEQALGRLVTTLPGGGAVWGSSRGDVA